MKKRIRHAFRILRNEGLLSLLIISLISIQKKQRRKSKSERYKARLNMPVKYADAVVADPGQSLTKWAGTSKTSLTFNWIMPPPGKGSGGHLNIFRFIKFLEDAGHTNRIYLYTQGEHGPASGVRSVMGDSYPELDAGMEWLEDGKQMAPADGIFPTSWETAYPAFNSTLIARRFYFVQDFEPYFYPVGSMSTLAENTYRFGFFGITAGGWLAKKLHTEYGMRTDSYNFGADTNLYKFTNSGKRNEIFFYVRPFTERRGFEIGIMALDIFHRKHPDYTINLAGWDVSEHMIPFPYKNLKTLELSELSELYNKCAAGLVLSFTNMSLLPLELLASGAIPVVNDGGNNRLVSDNTYIGYSFPNPVSLASKLSEVVMRNEPGEYARKASESIIESSWADSGRKFVEVIEKETRTGE